MFVPILSLLYYSDALVPHRFLHTSRPVSTINLVTVLFFVRAVYYWLYFVFCSHFSSSKLFFFSHRVINFESYGTRRLGEKGSSRHYQLVNFNDNQTQCSHSWHYLYWYWLVICQFYLYLPSTTDYWLTYRYLVEHCSHADADDTLTSDNTISSCTLATAAVFWRALSALCSLHFSVLMSD